jgi:hypothetical protein
MKDLYNVIVKLFTGMYSKVLNKTGKQWNLQEGTEIHKTAMKISKRYINIPKISSDKYRKVVQSSEQYTKLVKNRRTEHKW